MKFPQNVLFLALAATTHVTAFNAPFTLQRQNNIATFVSGQSRLVSQSRFSTAVPASETPVADDAAEDVAAPVAEEAAAEEVAEVVAEETSEESSEESAVAEEADIEKKVFVGNLPNELSQDDIVKIFEAHGTVAEITVPVDRYTGAIRGFAFVTLASEEDAANVIENMDGKEVGGRIVTVKPQRKPGDPKPKKVMPQTQGTKLYVGNLPFDTTQEEITSYFSTYGTVNEVYVPMDRNSGRPRGFAFVTVAESDSQNIIDNTDGTDFGGRPLQVNISLPKGKAPPRRSFNKKTKLYVGNLSFDTDEETLQDLFRDYGEILDIYVPIDKDTGRMRGFAFVTMESEAAERAAEETDGFELYGRILRVNEALPKGRQSEWSGGNDDDGEW
jgi:nucleolin